MESSKTGWALRAARSEHQLQYDEQVQNARISQLLGEMHPHHQHRQNAKSSNNIYSSSSSSTTSIGGGNAQKMNENSIRRKAHTTNIVDVSQMTARANGIYGSWQDRRAPPFGYGSGNLLPKYDQLYCNTSNRGSTATLATIGRREPPEYSKVITRPTSSWQMTSSENRPAQAGWLKTSRPLPRGTLSPAGYFIDLENKNGSTTKNAGGMLVDNNNKTTSNSQESDVDKIRTSSSSDSTLDSSSLSESHRNVGMQSADSTLQLVRNTPRQASFMAAMAAKEKETPPKPVQSTPIRRPRTTTRRPTSKSLGKFDIDFFRLRPKSTPELDQETEKSIWSWARKGGTRRKSDEEECGESTDSNQNNAEEMKMIRRARPKSYVLATSTSMNDEAMSGNLNEPSSSISHDDTTSGRELPSSLMGSTSSMDHNRSINNDPKQQQHTSRSLNAPHPPATHRLQRFIALFNSNKSQDGNETNNKKSRMKRSRTSLPSSRCSLPGTILPRELVDRQTWIKHQEIALGKSGKRHHWEDRWAIMSQNTLYLCIEAPSFTSEKTVELGSHNRVDVKNSIVDIAYDWLSATFSKQRHVIRIVTQNRSEHLIELNTESEMLSWISILQSNSEDLSISSTTNSPSKSATSSQSNAQIQQNNNNNSNNLLLHNSNSIASLASSSCSTTTSELIQQHHQPNSNCSTSGNENNIGANNRSATKYNQFLAAANSNQIPQSKSFGGLSSNSTSTESAKNQLIMHRYIAKNSQLQSPTANKKMEVGATNSTPPAFSATCASQAGTSKDAAENGGESTTPKSGRKWKKSKAAKQGSGNDLALGANQTPQPVLGVKLADCPIGTSEEHVPMIVQICVSVVQTHGMDTVGIYRIPGNTAAVNALRDSLSNRGLDNVNPQNVEALDPRWRDVNVVSSLLKMFLRKLPEPLLTDKLYPFFIDANRIATHHNRLHKLRNLLRKLPRPHYETLRFLILHLADVTKHSDVNKMECRNLALMFGPSIVRPSDDNMATMVTHMSDQCKIIETLIHYNGWMFDETSTAEDAVPEQHPADGQNPLEPGSYGVGVPTGVSAASFNDMHNLIRKANEDQAAAMMNEGKGQKIKNMLRRNSRRDKSKSKLKIESTAPAAVNPKWTQPTPSNNSSNSVESAFCGNYQERDIDAEIESRKNDQDQSPSLESSLGSLPDTSRDEENEEVKRRKRQEEINSARRLFIAGNTAAAENTPDADKAAIDALANHSEHLNLASSPALEVLSEETREKIRKMQKKQSWHDTKLTADSNNLLKTSYSPTKDLTDALSCTSDYSTTSSAPLSSNNAPPLVVTCQPNSSSDYASSDPSPCTRNPSTSPAARPANLILNNVTSQNIEEPVLMCREQKIRMRAKGGANLRDPTRRYTLGDVETLKQGKIEKIARWIGIRRSTPNVSNEAEELEKNAPIPPVIVVKTSPNELTPASGDEQL
ncbi:unnamed protein product [Caenorhabditis angaria]|uniref:Uncharacterized protein n=1 Tax=Caenorhabditis angaria TaxID=860376 RepID=A0A9P1IGA6_9PELO|nr:unnamed protein product [Caenorhabditis angaria]